MPRWEYRKIDLSDLPRRADDLDLLNDAGENGWELVTIGANGVAYFKRKVEDAPQAAPPPPRRRTTSRTSEPDDE
jgi:hypothetical protein